MRYIKKCTHLKEKEMINNMKGQKKTGAKPSGKINKETLKRLLKYITGDYKKTLIFVNNRS